MTDNYHWLHIHIPDEETCQDIINWVLDNVPLRRWGTYNKENFLPKYNMGFKYYLQNIGNYGSFEWASARDTYEHCVKYGTETPYTGMASDCVHGFFGSFLFVDKTDLLHFKLRWGHLCEPIMEHLDTLIAGQEGV